ncbi:hypothetical protein vseg_014583 [Gypsophila vaccaria]
MFVAVRAKGYPGLDMVVELSSEQSNQSSDASTEWRSSMQVEYGTPSTSPLPYLDTDDSDDDEDSKPHELYGKCTWKIEKFSQMTVKELRSNTFVVGGFEWYILIYLHDCYVYDYLSLFLRVANHATLPPGWNRFVQFTVAVVNKDPTKTTYSDTLHRFWAKDPYSGWQKFMELSKRSDGYVDDDTLTITAQVQVIRVKEDRLFRCLDSCYRRELTRVYLTNIKDVFCRSVDKIKEKLILIAYKAKWTSLGAIWLEMDQDTRRSMSREKKDTILKEVVKHFFKMREVRSTFAMDFLYLGLKALEAQSKIGNGKATAVEGEGARSPIIRVEKDMFVLADDAFILVEKAEGEPLLRKNDEEPLNGTMDGGSGGDGSNNDIIERDEKLLAKLGQRTLEIFVLDHIVRNILEVAYY